MTAVVEIIWDAYADFITRDVHEKWHKQVKDFMFENYFLTHRLFNQMNFQDDMQVNKQYLKYLDHILRDECSLIVVHKETNAIKAVALLKCMTKKWHSWTALQLCMDPCKLSDIIEMECRLIREYAVEYPQEPFDSLHLFEYYIVDELKYDIEFLNKFFNAIHENARLMKMPRVTFVALSIADQDECFDQGYDRLARAIYSIYRIRNTCPFAALRDIDEMEAGLFEVQVEPIEPYYNMKIRGIEETPRHDYRKLSMATSTYSRRTMASIKSAM